MEKKKGKTLFVRNLPYTATNDQLEQVFSEVGPIHRCFVIGSKGSAECRGFGYVTFALQEDAEKAIERVKLLNGRRLAVDFADRKPKAKKPKVKKDADAGDIGEETGEGAKSEPTPTDEETPAAKIPAPVKVKKKKKPAEPSRVVVTGFRSSTCDKLFKQTLLKAWPGVDVTIPAPGCEQHSALLSFSCKKDALQGAKKIKSIKCDGQKLMAVPQADFLRSLKTAKLIVRNLSFKVHEEGLKQAFNKHGSVTEISIPTQPDGKKRGFGFVQFSQLSEASKALKAMNSQAIQGRPVAVDWAVPKSKFQQAPAVSETPVKSQDTGESDDSGSFSGSDMDADKPSVKPGEESDSDSEGSADSSAEGSTDSSPGGSSGDEDCDQSPEGSIEEEEEEDSDSDSAVSDTDSDSDSGAGSESDVTDTDAESDSEDDDEDKHVKKKKPPAKTDVDEGKTLFIRNVSFDSDEDSLTEAFIQYGDLVYVRVVTDPNTEHSRGMAFVKFAKKEDAEKCMERAGDEGSGMVVDGRPLNVTVAVCREKATELQKNKKVKEKKDNRNLYLAREGMIRAGTQAAEGLSKEDLIKRMKVEEVKRRKLQNPSVFVSDRRLCVRNLPVTVDDKQLKKLYRKAVGDTTTKITECRVMRDMNQVNAKGVGKSRGYGFVAFDQHKAALQALRQTNNNPELFGKKKRLIVEFSLENKTALQAKERRRERIQTKQRLMKQTSDGTKPLNIRQGKKKAKPESETSRPPAPATGAKPTPPGKRASKGLPSHRGPKIRHKARNVQVSKEKPVQQAQKAKGEKRKRDKKPTPKQDSRRKKQKAGGDHFEKLVDRYRSQLTAAVDRKGQKGNKWFDS